MATFPESAPVGPVVFYRTYSRRKEDNTRESWSEVSDRTVSAIGAIGDLTQHEMDLIKEVQDNLHGTVSGRFLWIGGTEWHKKPENYSGAFNCTSLMFDSLSVFGKTMDLTMMGCGVGIVLEPKYISKLPSVKNHVNVEIKGNFGDVKSSRRTEATNYFLNSKENIYEIVVGDSRQGWAEAYQTFIDAAFAYPNYNKIVINISQIRPAYEKIKGFGGISEPTKFAQMFPKLAKILNGALGRQLTSVEICLLVDEAALVVVAGNVRRSAGMRQFDKDNSIAMVAKENLWRQDETGHWSIDPDRDALRMANHTRVYHQKPTLEECINAVRKQYFSGEGAIQWAGEAVARANADLINGEVEKHNFIKAYQSGLGREWLGLKAPEMDNDELDHRMERYGLNPCGEIIGSDFHCNLAEVELNMIDPLDFDAQHKAFTAMSLSVAALLKQGFVDPLYQYSRTIDPIVGVSFTGLFDYFVNAFGIKWLEWWQAGRPKKWGEIVSDFNQFTDLIYPYDLDKLGLLSYEYLDCQHISWWFTQIETLTLRRWRVLCENVIKSYCQKHGIKTPNRCTTVQPAGCGSRELLRIFDQGLIYADEVMSDGQGEVEGINLSVRNGISASKGIANEPIHLLKITLNNKRLLRLTPNHRLSVEGNWVRADELIKGMKLDYQIGLYQSTNEAELIPVDLTAYRKYNHAIPVGIYQKGYLVNITIPEKMSASLGYFLGALFGNGCNEQKQGSSRIRFTHQNTEILNKISSISLKLFGISGCLTEDKRGDKHELSLSSNPLYDWFQINGMTKPVKSKDLDRIPQVLRCSSTESILGFFCGLIDTDGCVRESGSLSIESASEKFIRNLQQIGEAVGLCFSISHNNKGSNYQQEKSIWSLSLSRMLSDPLAVKFLNLNSFKCQSRPIPEPSREFKFNPYQIDKIEWELEPDYSFDFAVDGQDDDDSWYWQGAIKSHNSKSLLTNASPGWHPPKAAWVIRRVTVPKNDPVALACLDYGYNIIPSADDKDDEGNLLYDIFDSNCKSWLVEIPLQVSWGDLPGLEGIDINKFSALAQFDFYSIIQREWTGHNTSATIELRKDEIEELATAIYENIQNDEGYISAALLSRSDDLSVYPRLPFEPITKEKYDQLHNEVLLRRFPGKTFEELLAARDLQLGYTDNVQGPAGCDSDKCLLG